MTLFETKRLRIEAFSSQTVRLALEDFEALGVLLGAQVDPDWPLKDLADWLPSLRVQLETTPGSIAYGGMIVYEGQVVGDVGLHQLPGDIVLNDREAEVGYSIVPSYRGSGIATEALIGLCNWATSSLKLRRLYGHCDRENEASRRVLQKAGFSMVPAGLDRLMLFERILG